MTSICREIFKAVHEGKWLSIEYKNRDGRITKYWIGIKSIDPHYRSMVVDGLHLGQMKVQELRIYIDSILDARLVEGSYNEINKELIEDIKLNPSRYTGLFDQIPNLRILEYLNDCNRLDATPFKYDYRLVHCFDGDSFENGSCVLSDEQFEEIVHAFQ